MQPGAQFSGARQGVRYRGNGGAGTHMYGEEPHQATLFDDAPYEVRSAQALRPIHPESVEYGHHASERPRDPATSWNGQLALKAKDMPKPTDPHLHRLRQENPNLSGLQFRMPNERRVTAHDEAGRRVGVLKLGYQREGWLGETHDGHREVEEIGVAPSHQGKGLAEGMYDLARMKGTKILHSSERSESGESFARRVGGPRMERKAGHGQDDYLGLSPRKDRV